MDNNKNRGREREKSNAEMRKMQPKDNAATGMDHGEKIGSYANSKNHHDPMLWKD